MRFVIPLPVTHQKSPHPQRKNPQANPSTHRGRRDQGPATEPAPRHRAPSLANRATGHEWQTKSPNHQSAPKPESQGSAVLKDRQGQRNGLLLLRRRWAYQNFVYIHMSRLGYRIDHSTGDVFWHQRMSRRLIKKWRINHAGFYQGHSHPGTT